MPDQVASKFSFERFWFAFAVFAVLMLLAAGGAEIKAMIDRGAGLSANYYRVIFTIWVTTVLLTAALCFHVFSFSDAANTYWRAFWTFAYLALLAHLFWSVFGTCNGDFAMIYGKKPQAAECVVEHPGPDFFLAAWWGLDVVLAWLVSDDTKWVRVQRGAVHFLAFAMFFGATVLAAKAGIIAHLLGIIMVLAVASCSLIRLITREHDPKSLFSVVYAATFALLNRFVVWHKLPTWLAVINLGALRDVLRAKNLHDTSGIPVTNEAGRRPTVPPDPKYLCEREEDGQYNDLAKPEMGNASLGGPDFTQSNPGARFGRNVPLPAVDPDLDGRIDDPSPRIISNRLLARRIKSDGSDVVIPAPSLNLLAGAWIQFQTHDWFNHGNPRPMEDQPIEVPLTPGDSWPEKKMLVRRTRSDPTRAKGDRHKPETFVNAETHWWDSSQIYGDSPAALNQYRSGVDGKLNIDPERKLIPLDPTGIEKTGLTSNWWLGLALLHNLFTLEHNAICDHLVAAFPAWKGLPEKERDAQIFRVARLVNNALMAKIHTVDWTPAILAHPALKIGMNANWWGLLGEPVKKYFGRISTSEVFSGIPGSTANQSGADYCLTEEFTAVYRLHPLLPSDIQVLKFANNQPGRVLKFEASDDADPDLIVGPHAMDHAMGTDNAFIDLLYTFGVRNPGAVTLQNFPNWMRRLHRRNGVTKEELIDLAAIDIIRDRERGVPRYNRFRELFHMPRVRTFEEMTNKPELASVLREVYGHPDKVDLMVGMYAETPPEGFGFSDTAFRVFILMASRRLKSDRFFTDDFTPAVYTQPGIDWVENNNMTTVLLRHFPQLTPVLQNVENPFAPWKDPMTRFGH